MIYVPSKLLVLWRLFLVENNCGQTAPILGVTDFLNLRGLLLF